MQELRDLQMQAGAVTAQLHAQHRLAGMEARIAQLAQAHSAAQQLQHVYKTRLAQLQRDALAASAEHNATSEHLSRIEAEAAQLQRQTSEMRHSTISCKAALQQARHDLREHSAAHEQACQACRAELRSLQQSCLARSPEVRLACPHKRVGRRSRRHSVRTPGVTERAANLRASVAAEFERVGARRGRVALQAAACEAMQSSACIGSACDSELWQRLRRCMGVASTRELRGLPQQQEEARVLLQRLLAKGQEQRACLVAELSRLEVRLFASCCCLLAARLRFYAQVRE